MCGIVGIVGKSAAAPLLYDALTMLQHRGQDAAGIATLNGSQINLHKGNGLVRDVFEPRHMANLTGRVGIGHVRYPTAGMEDSAEAQPFYVNSPYGLALGHNGNLINTEKLTNELFATDRRHLNTKSDSEVLLNVLAHELQKQKAARLSPAHIFEAVEGVYQRCRGAFSTVALICGHGLLAFRDPHGIRPMVLGSREGERGREYVLASESAALDVLGFELERDLGPGESVFITLDGKLHSHVSALQQRLTPCIFEYVYFARPDSLLDDISVYKARLR
ncbi:MAG: amidophosphoribosyltransferase, partial [Xanthomonadales bacterium]|nr:amidophosphoribosyltransferase [Xanthomonadales bacterium]